jgi:hypothetical protein
MFRKDISLPSPAKLALPPASAEFLPGLLFHPEYGGDMLLETSDCFQILLLYLVVTAMRNSIQHTYLVS